MVKGFVCARVQFEANNHLSKREQIPTIDAIVIFQNPKDVHCGSFKRDFPRLLAAFICTRYGGIHGSAGSHDPAAELIE